MIKMKLNSIPLVQAEVETQRQELEKTLANGKWLYNIFSIAMIAAVLYFFFGPWLEMYARWFHDSAVVGMLLLVVSLYGIMFFFMKLVHLPRVHTRNKLKSLLIMSPNVLHPPHHR
jgi:hypothetical protein